MARCCNSLFVVLNVVTFLLSVFIVWFGVLLITTEATECDKFLQKPVLLLGFFIMIISLIGIRGACCHSSGYLWSYLVLLMLIIVGMISLTVFTLAVTNRGSGQKLPGKAYKEYRMDDYSSWLRKRMNDEENWRKIKSCFVATNICSDFERRHVNAAAADKLSRERLSSVESGCCKPPDDCKFTYVPPTYWNKEKGNFTNADCRLWDNRPAILCYDCASCKAGLLDRINRQWKIDANLNAVVLLVLVIVFIVGCSSLSENRTKVHAYKTNRCPYPSSSKS
ncbi:hypothetical protein AB3S75_020933 [Citrus x aurantiifolia]